MTWDWQELAAFLIVGCAFCYVAVLVYRRFRLRKAEACGGGCFGCEQPAENSNQLVTSIGMSQLVDRQSRLPDVTPPR